MYAAAVQCLSHPTIRVCSCSMADRQLCSITTSLVFRCSRNGWLGSIRGGSENKALEIRREEELSVRQAIQILMKGDEDSIKVSWDNL